MVNSVCLNSLFTSGRSYKVGVMPLWRCHCCACAEELFTEAVVCVWSCNVSKIVTFSSISSEMELELILKNCNFSGSKHHFCVNRPSNRDKSCVFLLGKCGLGLISSGELQDTHLLT